MADYTTASRIAFIAICLLFLMVPWLTKKSGKGSFFLGTEDLGIVGTTFSLIATWIGATSTLALSQWTLELGPSAVLYLALPGLGLMALPLFAIARIRANPTGSLLDYFDQKAFKKVGAVFLVVLYTAILGAQLAGFGKVAEIFGLGYLTGVSICAAVVLVYLAAGGFSAVKNTDVIQLVLMSLAVTLLLLGAGSSQNLTTVVQSIPRARGELGLDRIILFGSLLLLMFVAQENHQRIRAAKSDFVAKASCFIAGVLMILFGVAITTVSLATTEGPIPIISIISSLSLIPFLVVSVGILAAALSTADTAANIASFTLVEKAFSFRSEFKYYAGTAFIVGVGAALAVWQPNVGALIMFCLNIYVGMVFPSVVSGMAGLRSKVPAVFLISLLVFSTSLVLSADAPGVWALASGLLVVLISYVRRRNADTA